MTTKATISSSTMVSSEAAAPRRRATFAAIGVIVLGALLLAWNLHGFGYTADEVSELSKAHRPWSEILRDVDDDLFPPLYQMTAAAWIRLWGTDAAARWLNVVYGVLTLMVVWQAGVDLLGQRDAIWPTLLLATSPFQVHFCREGRAYALYCLFAAGMFWGALRVLRRGSWSNWLLFVGSSAAAVYTHYYAGPLAAVIGLASFACTARRDGWQRGVAAGALLVLLLLPAPFLLQRALADLPDEKLFAGFDLETLGYSYVSLATGFTAGPSMRELRSISALEGVREFLPWIGAIGFAYAVLGWQSLRRLSPPSLAVLLTPLLLLVPLLGVLGNLTETGFVFRYLAWMVISYALVLGAGASRWRESRLAAVAVVVLLAVNTAAIYNRRANPRYAEEDFRAVAARLDELDPSRRPVLIASHYMGAALDYYVAGSRQLFSVPIFSHHAADREARLHEFLAGRSKGTPYWIVSQWLPADDVRRATRDELLKQLGAKLEAELVQCEIYSAKVQ